MGYVLVRLFQAFEAVTIEQPEIEKQFSRIEITMSPGAGVKVRFRPATI